MPHSPTRRRAVIFLMLTALLWSSSGLFVKLIAWQPLSILSARSMISSLVFLVYLRRWPFPVNRWQVAAALCYVGAQLFFITATKLTTAANAIFLQYTAPLYVILLGYWLLGERPQRADWIWMPVILVGLVLFFGDRLSLTGMYGNIVAIISGVALAGTMVCMRGPKIGHPANAILLGNFISVLIGLPALARETWTLANVGSILYLGVFQIGLSFVLYTIAIQHVPALEATLILTLEPVLNPVWVFLVLGETPGRLALMGGLIVLGAIVARGISGARAGVAKASTPEPG
jgi:drug/metabolite transporter (DMT)-like permease